MRDIFSLLVIVLAFDLPQHLVTGQTPAPGSQCSNAVQTLITECVRAASVSDPNFLWFVTNGTSVRGSIPADQAAFRTQVCGAQQQIGTCVVSQVGSMFNATICQGQQQVSAQLERLFQTFDMKCAHPCRNSLLIDMRACYTKNGLNADLFLSNRTKGHVIGSTAAEVNDFCAKRVSLLNCMKPLAQDCPESISILQSRAFDIPSYEKGVDILCTHYNVYLTGLACFDESTAKVDQCAQTHVQAFIQKSNEAQRQNWTQEMFFKESCDITIKQTDCDLNAWSQKNHEACTDTVIGLRREVECSLMPPNCTILQKASFDHVCHPEKFNKEKRDSFRTSPAAAPKYFSSMIFIFTLFVIVIF